MRVLSTLTSWSNENKSYMSVDELVRESLYESFVNSHVLVKREQELHEEFSQLSCLDQTRTRVARELMRVDNREFVSEFSQLSCPGQTRTRVT